jgi:hypothetical protein
MASRLPNDDILHKMRIENLLIYYKMENCCEQGRAELASIHKLVPRLDMQENAALFLSTTDRMYMSMSPGRMTCVYSRVIGTSSRHTRIDFSPSEKSSYCFALPDNGDLIRIRLRIFDTPFVVSPVVAGIETADRVIHSVDIKNNYIIDTCGNWIFEESEFFEIDLQNPIVDAKYLHIQFTLLLSQEEVSIAIKQKNNYTAS